MAEFKRQEVLQSLYNMALTVCENVFTSSRPTAVDRMDSFIVVRLPQGIDLYADTHNTAYAQFNIFVRDRQGGIESVDAMETLVSGITDLFPIDDGVVACNGKPTILTTKTDGMGFHSTIIQFKIIIKL